MQRRIIATVLAGLALATRPLSSPAREPALCGGTSDSSDPRAPKAVRSQELVRFEAAFTEASAGVYDRHCPARPHETRYVLPRGAWRLALARDGQAARLSLRIDPDGGPQGKPFEARVPARALDRLQALLARHDVASFNGWHKSNSALGCDFSLEAVYASGETISASGRGGVSVLPPRLPQQAVCRLFAMLATEAGCKEAVLPSFAGLKRLSAALRLTAANRPESYARLPDGLYRLELSGSRARASWQADGTGRAVPLGAPREVGGAELAAAAALLDEGRFMELDGYEAEEEGGALWLALEARLASGRACRVSVRARTPQLLPARWAFDEARLLAVFEALAGELSAPQG